MRITVGSIIEINQNVRYRIAEQHRYKVNKDKSRWTLSLRDEVSCFKRTHDNGWIDSSYGWGLHLVNEKIEVLGVNPQNESLKVAKFVDSSEDGNWHGYPADYRNKNNEDRPNIAILLKWFKQGLIKKHQIERIRSGKKCAL